MKNCAGRLLSKPYSARRARMSSGGAPGPIIIPIGSPGATRNRTNTTTSTPKSVGSAHNRRFSGMPSSLAGLADRLREQVAGQVRLHRQRLLEKDGLHLLVERQHERVVGDVLVDLLPAGDALGFVLFAPQRADHGVEFLRLPA